MLGYTIDQQVHHECHVMTFGVHVHKLVSWHEYVYYTKYDISCALLFGITQCYKCLLCISFFTNQCNHG